MLARLQQFVAVVSEGAVVATQATGGRIDQVFVDGNPGSQELYARARRVIAGGVTHDVRVHSPFPVMVDRAEGSRKWDVDGNEYIDYTMGHGALILGHAHPIPTQAAIAQLSRGTHYGASHEIETAWAEQICELMPSVERVRFTGSGTEATLMAMRLARAHTGRERIVKFHYHFHGWHDFAHVGQIDAALVVYFQGWHQWSCFGD
ncbi:MAG: aminotransferase class III-fold pyridoxal phosphate-dependent enzyme [Chloroflexi bacterium]|nr:aminotransferase class III-fold pyridoxal phosphate-dependent enzyme [Chloroflexota bacterium]